MTSDVDKDLFFRVGDQSVDGYFGYDFLQDGFFYLNDSIADLWGIGKEQIQDNPSILMDLIHPEDREHVKSCVAECMEDWKFRRYEFRLLTGPEQEKYVKISAYPLDGGEKKLLGIIEDITVERHNKISIEQINARKNITLEVLSHDLKEPLAMMRLMATSMEKEIAAFGSGDLITALDFIKDMCSRNIMLIRSVINKEFLKSAEVEIKRERTEIIEELKQVLRLFKRAQIRFKKNFQFKSTVDKLYLPVDVMKFVQVINNLISNSIKFTDENGFIGLFVDELEDTIRIAVQDNGIGIPAHLQKDLFNRVGETLRPGLKGEESGGLGMGIIKTIVELHQGKIYFTSAEGQGTTFYIELPKS